MKTDRFGAEPWNRSRAVVVDAQGQRPRRHAKAENLGVEQHRPTSVIGHDFKGFSQLEPVERLLRHPRADASRTRPGRRSGSGTMPERPRC